MENDIEKNLKDIREKIKFFAQKYKRNLNDIELIAVSKHQSIENIRLVYQCGIKHFGENYVQEWQEKSDAIKDLPNLKWHLIGNIQSNKAKFINSQIHCIQSLDKMSLAKEIEKRAPLENKMNILVQLQIDKNDKNKSGISFENAKEICDFITHSHKMELSGFMGMGPLDKNPDELRKLYSQFSKNAEKLWLAYSKNPDKKYNLSLGMSSDYEVAIECGSTLLRIGTAIFGKRK